jgi:twitching motility two-component system response regulator PilG
MQMLRAGIKAMQDGNRAEARQLLLRVTDAEPNNENAWLWLASISEYPEELLIFLFFRRHFSGFLACCR